jgi:hypothetical protein
MLLETHNIEASIDFIPVSSFADFIEYGRAGRTAILRGLAYPSVFSCSTARLSPAGHAALMRSIDSSCFSAFCFDGVFCIAIGRSKALTL